MKRNSNSPSLWLLKYRFLQALYSIRRLSFPGSSRFKRFLRKRVFADLYIRTPYLGHFVYVCPTHVMGETVFDGGVHEPEITTAIQAFVRSGFSFLDCGANIGLHTLVAAFARKDEKQIFISFEPDASIFSVLQKNCGENGLGFVECRQEGLGDQDTFLTLNVSQTHNKGRNSFLPIESSQPGGRVKVTKLDTLFLETPELFNKNILIKLDVEGYELPVIRGGFESLPKIENLAVICEIWPELMERNGLKVSELHALMKQCGFLNYKAFSDGQNVIFYKGNASEALVQQLAWQAET